MSVACLAFTEKGFLLAQTLARELDGTAERSGRPYTLQQWTQQHFLQERALIYVGAVGIAVRAIAPYLQSKAVDPAVRPFCNPDFIRASGRCKRSGTQGGKNLWCNAGHHHRNRYQWHFCCG